MLSYYLLPLCPPLMRFYRTRILIDLPPLLGLLPKEGRLLDVGCGTGLLDYAVAKRRPKLTITGIDIDDRAVDLAARFNRLPNLEFAAVPLGDMRGPFDCVTFVDVMHHATEEDARGLLQQAAELISDSGHIVIKDIARKGGWASYAHDKYITRSKVIRLANIDETLALIPPQFLVTSQFNRYRIPFPNYYITLSRATADVNQSSGPPARSPEQ